MKHITFSLPTTKTLCGSQLIRCYIQPPRWSNTKHTTAVILLISKNDVFGLHVFTTYKYHVYITKLAGRARASAAVSPWKYRSAHTSHDRRRLRRLQVFHDFMNAVFKLVQRTNCPPRKYWTAMTLPQRQLTRFLEYSFVRMSALNTYA